MKIAFVNLGLHYGGVEIYLLSLIKAWKNMGNECLVLARKDSRFYHTLMQEGFSQETIPVEFRLKSIRETKKYIKREQIDLFHMNGINSGVFVSLMNLSTTRVATVHGNAAFDRAERNVMIQKLFVWLENITLKKCKKIIAVSGSIRDMLIKRGVPENKITVVYNGIEKKEYTPKERADVFRLCFVGRLETVKGCEYLIKALAKIKERNFVCDIYGEGSLQEELKQLAGEHGLNQKLVFKGFSDTVRDTLNQYDVLVQPSVYEAFSLTLVEAMNARVLIICSDVGGMSELVSHKDNGLKFPVGDIQALAQNIVWAMEHSDDSDVMKENAYEKFMNRYTTDVMKENTFRLFERINNEC